MRAKLAPPAAFALALAAFEPWKSLSRQWAGGGLLGAHARCLRPAVVQRDLAVEVSEGRWPALGRLAWALQLEDLHGEHEHVSTADVAALPGAQPCSDG